MVQQKTGLPFAKGLESCVDLPHTITSAVAMRAHIEAMYEIPKDKRPPYGMWDKMYQLQDWVDHMWDKDGPQKQQNSFEINFEDAE